MKSLDKALSQARARERLLCEDGTVVPTPSVGRGADATKQLTILTREAMPLSPELINDQHLCVLEDSDTADAFRVIRTQVLQGLRANDWNTLAVVSPTRGDGKSLSALNLGFAISQDSRNTALVVDLDLRSPSLHRMLGLEVERGVEAYLTCQPGVNIEQIMICVDNPRFAILPCVEPLNSYGSSALLTSERSMSLVCELSQRYSDRVVIFDLPAVLDSDDVLSFLPQVDAVLLIVGEGISTKQQVQAAMVALGDKPVLGVVLNKANS